MVMPLVYLIVLTSEVLEINFLLTVKLVLPSLKVFKPNLWSIFATEDMVFQEFHMLLQLLDISHKRCLQHPLNVLLCIDNWFN